MTRTQTFGWTRFLAILVALIWVGCGDSAPLIGPDPVGAPLRKAVVASRNQATVIVQIANTDGTPASGLSAAISPSIAGVPADAVQTAVTDASGQAQFTVDLPDGKAGYYEIAAKNPATNQTVGRWTSIPVNTGETYVSLPIGGKARVYPQGLQFAVMTRNLYWGADINRVIAPADPTVPLPVAVAQAWQMVQHNNFPERAKALADEIAAAHPLLIGLQECNQFRIQSPGDVLKGNPVPATDMALDMLSILLSELEARGLTYRAVAVSKGADFELPMYTGATTPMVDIRMTNLDVILAHSSVQTDNAVVQQYAAKVPVTIGGVPTAIPRAWASVEATVAGHTVRFFTTHLETGGAGPIQRQQAAELLQHIAEASLPVIAVGDYNSDAYGSTTATYADVIGAGMVDAFQAVFPGRTAYTSSLGGEDLLSPAQLHSRIDQIFVRETDSLTPVFAEIVGDKEKDRTPSGLWPSDHAGLTATIRLPVVNPF